MAADQRVYEHGSILTAASVNRVARQNTVGAVKQHQYAAKASERTCVEDGGDPVAKQPLSRRLSPKIQL
jgi:hypothetical protein